MMEFEDEHDEEQEEEEEDEDEITIPPPAPQLAPPPIIVPPSYDSVTNSGSTNIHISRPRVSSERRSSVVRYRECLKNHAVSIGGHAVDGCGEFMPAGEDGTLDALKCAACNCHRNFHRKETDMSSSETFPSPGGGAAVATPAVATAAAPVGGGVTTPSPTGALYPQFSAYYRTPAGYMSHHHHQHQHHYRPLAALPSTSGGTHSGDDMSHPSSSGGEGRRESGSGGGGGSGSAMMMVPKKRFRTKFTQYQKDKMLDFAEKLGWRIQKHDEAAVQQFCAENQIKRQVLKVWMHNNKHTLGKKP